ncbi:hypothetical protein ABFX02_05G050850 [Erythranthe guttata]|uniref:uncharacterized protein LOC105966152 n=1 Tax=Erythranthe guttata TaxID=4155 RepID=UPI00064E00A2|nr:PREDICTED: uncharacterized protein LOC105966152 [Erythranthe guttata]|eukprot:XP_012846168.1 PREDICTED: uncharacterized protein LOC105966152 [Erythranthe guttata]
MGSNMEPVAVTSQKHDPAWKHCQMFKSGDRVQLKCVYCGKIFKGGGIHRIKEHIAGQKGNAAACLRVQPDVRQQMLESLNGVAVKKRKKQKLAEDITGFDSHCGLSSDIVLLPVPESVEHDEDVYANRDDDSSSKAFAGGGRQKKGRVRKAPNNMVNSSSNAALAVVPSTNSKKVSNTVNMAVGRFLSDVGLAADSVDSPYFQPMIDAIASQGVGVVGPTYHDLRNSILKNLFHEVRYDVDQYTVSWEQTGCSILVDEWTSRKGNKTFVNFFVYCPQGTIFFRSADISHSNSIDSADAIYELIKETVEQVGLRFVVQVVTSGEDRYVVAGKRLADTYPTVFWTPCAGRCIDSMLEDIGVLPAVKAVLERAKSISRYIYSSADVLNMTRRYTSGVDLVDLGFTRSSTDFTTLKRISNIRHNLQSMVTSEEWVESPCSKTPQGFQFLDSLSDESFWSECDSVTRLTDPLLRVLRIVGSKKNPAMGFVYAGLYRAKEAIKKELVSKAEYSVYWNIIDARWEQLRRHPLHAAGFYLNPKFFYSLEGDAHLQIRSLVYDCIEKLIPDPNVQDKIIKETASYHGGVGDFGRKMAIRARDTLLPTEWWLQYGGGCPNLARLAIRILSQTCGLIQHKLDKAHVERMHERKNCLEHQRLSDLVFVHYNMSMKQMVSRNKAVDPISYEYIDIVQDWVMEKESCVENSSSAEWMAVDPPFGNHMILVPQTDDFEALGAGFDDYEIFDGVKDSEEENVEDKVEPTS